MAAKNTKQKNKEIVDKLKKHSIIPNNVKNITVKEMRDIAKHNGIRGYSRKCKKDLADFIIINSADPVHEIRESNSALKGFTKQYTMDGSEGIDAMSFFNDILPQVTDLLSKNTFHVTSQMFGEGSKLFPRRFEYNVASLVASAAVKRRFDMSTTVLCRRMSFVSVKDVVIGH